MTILNKNFQRAALGVAMMASGMAVTVDAGAQAVLNYTSYGFNLALDVPNAVATPTCTTLAAGAATTPVKLKQTFIDLFDAPPDLSTNRWTPYFGGEYDAVKNVWTGSDLLYRRTQTAGHEQQLYVDPAYKGTTKTSLGFNPFSVENGILHIVAQKTPTNLVKALSGYEYTSGVLTTRRSFAQRYGYFEARMQVPSTPGLLPAFWMVPTIKVWPPELDIMEAPTHLPNQISQNVHWVDAKGALKDSSCKINYANYSGAFHQYGAYWTPTKIVYYIDRIPVAQIATPPGLNLPMYMIMNLAVGGDWVGKVNATTPIPAEMLVDAVVVYSAEGPTVCGTTAEGLMQCPAK
jgi:beta-glucanase (GH16 family)